MKLDLIEMHESKFVSKCIDSVAQNKKAKTKQTNKNPKKQFTLKYCHL